MISPFGQFISTVYTCICDYKISSFFACMFPDVTTYPGSVYPSIYAMWHIQLTGYESANLSLPVTNINLKIGLQTASPVGTRRKRFIANTGLNHRFVTHSALMPIRCYTFSQQEMQVKYMYMYFVYIKYEIRH